MLHLMQLFHHIQLNRAFFKRLCTDCIKISCHLSNSAFPHWAFSSKAVSENLFCFNNSEDSDSQTVTVCSPSFMKYPKITGHSLRCCFSSSFLAAKHAVKLDQEPAWRPELISHAAHIDVSQDCQQWKKKQEGNSWQGSFLLHSM